MALGSLTGGGNGSGGGGGGGTSPQTDRAVNAYISGAGASAGGYSQSQGMGANGGGGGLGTPESTGINPAAISGLVNSYYQHQNQGLYNSQQDLMNQLGLNDAQYDTQSGYLRTNAGLDQRGIALDRQGLGIDRQAVARQLADTAVLQRIMTGQRDNARTALAQQYDQNQRAERSDATARGAFTTPGTRQNLKDLFGGLMVDNSNIDLGFDRDMLGLKQTRDSLRDQQKQLDLQSQRYGLSSQQIRTQLSQALGQLGLDQMMTANDIFGALNDGNAQRRALAQQMLDDIMQFGGGPGWLNPLVASAPRRDDWYGQMRRGN